MQSSSAPQKSPFTPGRPHAVDEFSRECTGFFSEIVQAFGVPPSVGGIYGLLYASPHPLSFTDIVERLDISKGSASQGLQLLRSLGAVQLVESPSSSADTRREYFEPELSLRKLVAGVLREKISPLAATGSERVARLREIAGRNSSSETFHRDRVKQLDTWRRRLSAVMPVLQVLLGPGRGTAGKQTLSLGRRASGHPPDR